MNDQELLTRVAAQFPADEAMPEKIWVACSGGLDSSVLLLMLDVLQRAQPVFGLGVLHVNYGLRGAESDRDEAIVRAHAARLGRELRVLSIDPSEHPPRHSGIQEWARKRRYDWFAAQTGPRDWIAVAHHRDDWIETILARLCRGHSLLALSGMQVLHAGIWRPLLNSTRAELKAWGEAQGVVYGEDSSNQSLDYTRNRLRRQILPELEQLFPGVGQNLWMHAQDLGATLQVVQEHFPPLALGPQLEAADLKGRPAFLARHEIGRYLLAEVPTVRVSRDLLETLYAALQSGAVLSRMLEPGIHAACQKGVLRVEKTEAPQNERWQQYRAALLDESLDLWPPGK